MRLISEIHNSLNYANIPIYTKILMPTTRIAKINRITNKNRFNISVLQKLYYPSYDQIEKTDQLPSAGIESNFHFHLKNFL